MKKNIFLISFYFLLLNNSYARSGIGGSGMEIDHETFGGGTHGNFSTELLGGLDGLSGSFGPGGGLGLEFPRDLSIPTERPFQMEFSRTLDLVGR